MIRAAVGRVAPAATRASGAARAQAVRHNSVLPKVYNTLFKNNTVYVTFVVVGSVVLGTMYNRAVDGLWESYNSGKLYHHIDWSKWAEEEEEEDEEEDEE